MTTRPSFVPLFATQGTSSHLVEPPTLVRQYGFVPGSRPPAQWFNYLFHSLGNWTDRLRSPSRANWIRATSAVNFLQLAVDTVSSDLTLTTAIRKCVAIDDGATNRLQVSVRGDDWTQITMAPGASIGAAKCVARTLVGWIVGGSTPDGAGGIWFTPGDPDGSSAVKNPANNWTVATLPGAPTPVQCIACRLTPGAGSGIGIAGTTDAILYSTDANCTTWALAALGTGFGGPATDACDSGGAFLVANATGQVFRAVTVTGTWSEVATLGAATWQLAANGTGTVVAYPVGAAAGTGWYLSTDHGLTWAAHTAPAYIGQIRRIRFLNGSWLLASSDFPFLAESNDLSSASWARLPVPVLNGAAHRLDDIALVDEGMIAVGEAHWLRGARGEEVAPGPWAPVPNALPYADAGYLRGRLVSNVVPGAGQVLTWDASNSVWKPSTVSGGGSLPAGTNGGVLAYAGGAWASTAAGTARQVLTSAGAGAATWGQDVLPLRIGSTVSAALPADAALGLQWDVRSIVVRGSGNVSWMDVWRVNGVGEWVFGTDDATDCGGAVLLVPASGAGLYLRRGSTNHVAINSVGALTLGTTSHATTLQGSALTIGLSSVVALYQGGARVPERTVSSSTTLDAQDEVVFVDTSGGAVTLTLPTGASGRVLAIQRIAGSNNIVVQRAGADTIRQGGTGALTSWTISDDARHGLIYRSGGSEWVAEA